MDTEIKPIIFTEAELQFLKSLLSQITVNPISPEALGVVTLVQAISFKIKEATPES
jgi:hypothetical protein